MHCKDVDVEDGTAEELLVMTDVETPLVLEGYCCELPGFTPDDEEELDERAGLVRAGESFPLLEDGRSVLPFNVKSFAAAVESWNSLLSVS